MPIKNYTTSVNQHKSVSEIQAILGRKGARQIQIQYSEAGQPEAISFCIIIFDNPVFFKLPRNTEGVLKALKANKSGVPYRLQNSEHAACVSWRILKDWIDAQMAIVEANCADLAQVFLPYAVTGQAQLTVYDQFLNSRKALNAAPQEAEEIPA